MITQHVHSTLDRTLSCSLHSSGGGCWRVYYSRIPVWVSPFWDRVWVMHFLASAMIISHASAAGGPPSPCSSIYIRLHPQEPTKNCYGNRWRACFVGGQDVCQTQSQCALFLDWRFSGVHVSYTGQNGVVSPAGCE